MERRHQLLAGALLRRNVVVNLLGQGLPLVAALVAVPPLLRGLGEDRFGVLALAWALVSYFGVFDLGLGRALTQVVARRLGQGQEEELDRLIGPCLLWLALLGLGSAGAFFLLAPFATHHLLTLPAELAAETLLALRLLGLALPAVILSAGLRGLLEARQRFVEVNRVRVPMALLAFLGPLAVLPFSPRLPAVVAVLVAARILGLVGYLALTAGELPRRWPTLTGTGEVLRLGGWMTVSNLVAPLLLYLDRFVIGALLPVAALTWYATPYEVVSRLGIVPAAVLGVLFPAFTTSLSQDPAQARKLYRRSLLALAAFLVPAAAVLMALAHPGLTLWLGGEMADRSFRVAQLLAAGAVLHGLAQPSFHLLQAAGKPRLTAQLHLAETPLYLLYLVPLTVRFGVEGTAAAWLLRVTLSCLALGWLAHRHLRRHPLEAPT